MTTAEFLIRAALATPMRRITEEEMNTRGHDPFQDRAADAWMFADKLLDEAPPEVLEAIARADTAAGIAAPADDSAK